MHLVELLDADTEELVGQIFGFLLVHPVVADNAQDESSLAFGAVPGITNRFRLMMAIGTVWLALDLVGAAVANSLTIVGLGDEANVLDFLIDGVLQKFVKPLNFCFDLADVREFDFDGRTEAVAAKVGQSELFAIVGAEFDSHDVWVVVCGHEKTDALSRSRLSVCRCGLCYLTLLVTAQVDRWGCLPRVSGLLPLSIQGNHEAH